MKDRAESPTTRTPTKEQLVSELVEAFVDWRHACVLVDDAHRSWEDASGRLATRGFGPYVAERDHEQPDAGLDAAPVGSVGHLLGRASIGGR